MREVGDSEGPSNGEGKHGGRRGGVTAPSKHPGIAERDLESGGELKRFRAAENLQVGGGSRGGGGGKRRRGRWGERTAEGSEGRRTRTSWKLRPTQLGYSDAHTTCVVKNK